MSVPTQVLAARWIVPVIADPIPGGWIRLRGSEVVEIGRGVPPTGATDLGDVAILPGLINAHTHLEFSDFPQPIGQPGIPLERWIVQVIGQRLTASNRDAAIAAGLRESAATGVRLLADITTTPSEYPADRQLPEVIALAEVLGLSPIRSGERLQAAAVHNERYANAGYSPHAPYSTAWETIGVCVDAAAAMGRPLAIHVAESPAERELLSAGSGPLAETLQQLGVWREDCFPWGPQPFVQLIDRLSAAPRALLVHGNDFNRDEIRHLAQHHHLSVVYCPRTHAFFGHPPHPVAQLVAAGVRVALGTDSRASNPDLNLWREVQFLLRHRTDLDPQQVLAMATHWGAEALGRDDLGGIAVGMRPGLGIVRSAATTSEALAEDLARCDYETLNDVPRSTTSFV